MLDPDSTKYAGEHARALAASGNQEDSIREFERLYHDGGTIIIKFWLHISREEQLRRFEQRGSDPFKRYKLTADDWRNREAWDLYMHAVDDMFEETHVDTSPWVLVHGEQKRHARIQVLRTVLARLQQALE